MKKMKQSSVCETLKSLLNDKLTVTQREKLHIELGISKKKLTMFLRSPERFTAVHFQKISQLTGISIDEFLIIINP